MDTQPRLTVTAFKGMVYSSSEHPSSHPPRPSLSSQVLPLLSPPLPLELAYEILNLSHLFRRTWIKRLENVSSKPVNNRLEYAKGGRTYLQSPVLGARRLRKVLVNVILAPWKEGWPVENGPCILRASLVRPLLDPDKTNPQGAETIVCEEPLEPHYPKTWIFSVYFDDDSPLIMNAQKGDRIRISLLPHYRTRSGMVPVVKEVTLYLYCEW
ncbi:hypothetical protein DACRYDRAFT_109886 [Dacryopinax primogenitus]|uniref:Uncharacterized protein n=1 Tax=Dacryopinax primogenitus (strain DJM 731) TaxID=1858805 RepID=M5G030_DACPD|nr:uncharacterized protein DACRYDRAFT_109886 [Dacryopinax primogenitus]EJT99161.1 hypothetical protein DACRYDRAFT_109886 [Dacryopinax primogenitus]